MPSIGFTVNSLNAIPSDHLLPCGSRTGEKVTNYHLLHGHSRAPVTCLSLGHLYAIALCFYLCSRGHLGGRLGAIVGCRSQLVLGVQLGQMEASISSLLWCPLGCPGRRPGSHQQEEQPRSIKQVTARADKIVKQGECSFAAGGNTNLYSRCGNQGVSHSGSWK